MNNACTLAQRNLEEAVTPVLAKYRSFLEFLRPGQSRDIYPWRAAEDVVMETARLLTLDGWLVVRQRYTGSTANYSGGGYFIKVTAPNSCSGR